MRHTHDNYPTPHSIIDATILTLWGMPNFNRVLVSPVWTPWEPCAGDGRFADAIDKRRELAHRNQCRPGSPVHVIQTDITTGEDFFDYDEALSQCVITNPPFKVIREFIDHAFDIGVTSMALVCPERLWACQKGWEQKQRHNPSHFVNFTWREDYLQKGGSPDRSLALSIWQYPHNPDTEYLVLNRV